MTLLDDRPSVDSTIAILNYGTGNMRSVEKAFEQFDAPAVVTSDPDEIEAAAGIVLIGVGAFPNAIARIRELKLDEVMTDRARSGVPLLGICLGMQLLFEESDEWGGAKGLGLLEGRVEKIPAEGEKVPHIGWNAVEWTAKSRLIEGIDNPCPFYHVHSFAPVPEDREVILGTAVHGSRFVTAVRRDNIYGVQFHPEKSGPDGLRMLENFATICTDAPVPA
jgi:glutamine amidotransferase